MSEPSIAVGPVRWTWADLFSTYRFWALFVLYVYSAFCMSLMTLLLIHLRVQMHWTISDYSLLFRIKSYSVFFALWLAWITARWKTKPMLVSLAVLQVIGFSLLVFPGLDNSFIVRAVGAFCWGMGYYALLLAIAALVAGSLGGTENFVVAFGVLFAVSVVAQNLPSLIGDRLMTTFGGTFLAYFVLLELVVGAVVPLFARKTFFQEAPPARGYSFSPTSRSPVAAALLCTLVPFYILYWLYKVHGEVASIAPSRALLSPRAAVGISFVPFMGPIMLTTLVDEMNGVAARRGLPRLRSPWSVFFLTLFLPPVAIGLVQSALNESANRVLQNAPAVPSIAT